MDNSPLKEFIPTSKEAGFYTKKDNNIVLCELCANNCQIKPGEAGFCGVINFLTLQEKLLHEIAENKENCLRNGLLLYSGKLIFVIKI